MSWGNDMAQILLIDDDTFLRQDMAQILEIEGFDVIEAANGVLGVQYAKDRRPDLILCDIMMAELDGYGVLMQVRSDPSTAAIPFVFVTARTGRNDTRYGMTLGADDYLTKPFSGEELLATVNAQLEKRASVLSLSEQKLDHLRHSVTLALPHELRTPLLSITGFSEVLISDAYSMAVNEIVDLACHIKNSAQRLNRLFENYLLYTRLEVLKSQPAHIEGLRKSRCIQPSAILKYLIFTRAQQLQRTADLQLSIDDTEAVVIEEQSLGKVVDELIDNAFKFSTPGTPVDVTAFTEGEYFVFSICNQGYGMTMEQIAGIGAYMQFERKFHEQQGTGLGLAIAKQLAELYGGALSVQCVPDQNLLVRVALPLAS
jgi:two-component system, sensor histidine kinase and response regulator